MTLYRALKLALVIARRELRSGVRGFGIFLTCLALGVGAMSMVGLITTSLQAGLNADAAKILGGDLVLSLSHGSTPDKALALLKERGSLSRQVQMRTMAHINNTVSLTEIKAVDNAYPLYGKVQLASGRTLSKVFKVKTRAIPAVLEQALLNRLGAKIGDEISIGAATLIVVDVLLKEPDRATASYALGPRAMLPLSRLEETKLLQPGAIATHIYCWRANPGENSKQMREKLNSAFPNAGWRIRDLSNAGGGLGRFLGYLGQNLSLVALGTLLLGGIGVAGGVAGHLAKRDSTIATMKCLGASQRTILATYLFQILFLAGLGSILGLVFGTAAAWVASSLLAKAFQIPVRFGLHMAPMLTALAFGLLTGLAFSLWPLSAATRTTPARLFTGYADPGSRRPTGLALSLIALVALTLFALTWFSTHDQRIALGFAGALLVGSLVFGLLAWFIRLAATRCRRPTDPRLALAVSNLNRPGSATTPTVFSLGFGLAVLCCVVLVEGNLSRNVETIMPATAPSYFFINVRAANWKEFKELVHAVPGVTRLDATAVIRGRITGLAGQAASERKVSKDVAWALRGDRFLSFAAELPQNSRISTGQWWPPDYAGVPLVSLEHGLAEGFGLSVGDTMTFNVLGQSITAEISNLRRVDWTTLELNQAVIFSPGVLEDAPYTWLASAHAKAEAEPILFKAVTTRFPDVVALYMKDVLSDVSEILGHVRRIAGSAAGLTLIMGLMILSEAVRGTLRTRRYDLVVFKVFGATKRDVLISLAAEFLLQGTLTACVAATLGSVGAWLFITKLLKLSWMLMPGRLAVVALGGVILVVLLGLIGVRKVLSQKAWPLLKNE